MACPFHPKKQYEVPIFLGQHLFYKKEEIRRLVSDKMKTVNVYNNLSILITGIGNAKVIDNIRTQSFQYCFFPNILKKFSFSFPQHIQGLFVDSVERYILSSTNKTKFKMKCIYVSQNIVFVSHISCSFFDFCFFIHRTILNVFCFLQICTLTKKWNIKCLT